MAGGTDPSVELMRQWLGASPFVRELGIVVDELEPEHAVLTLPFRQEHTTIGDVVHGGALSSLVDTAATAAAWLGADVSRGLRGTTVALTVNFVGAARSQDVTATARVVRRGRTIAFVEVRATGADGSVVATGLATYKLG